MFIDGCTAEIHRPRRGEMSVNLSIQPALGLGILHLTVSINISHLVAILFT